MANSRNLNYVATFTSDTSALKASLTELKTQLSAIANTNINISAPGAEEAVYAARDLQKYLSMATDSFSGNLDLSKFSQSLKAAGTDVTTLSTKLLGIGSDGTAAFTSLARTMAQAQIPLRQNNALLTGMWSTMKNTARWQLTSSMLHGFMGALSSTVGYAKSLDTSLNNIRIVTSQSSDEMQKFAEYANDAAKALNTTTVDYTDAALIYYQQGDSDDLVKAKTDVTVRAANAAGSSAEEMSEYLTAIWNSYQVGEESLEHFVDVIAKLGAETATSLEEIATGMQKVAATGNAVGVEYEQLAAILSTVSSVTRQAPESIGTAYKTILARIGDLKLGGTDEDGETLGSVSSQLDSLGVHILDANGDLRDMGIVVEELGDKWQTMSNATQVAVAQVVAGKRQYTNLIALFDNWDMYQKNMSIAGDSEGQLDEMAEIQAESWNAASKQAKASMESLYSDILNGDMMIDAAHLTSSIVDGADLAIDSVGGLQNILIGLAGFITTKFSSQISQSVAQTVQNVRVSLGFAQKDMMSMQQEIQKGLMAAQSSQQFSPYQKVELESISRLITAKQHMTEVQNTLTVAEKEYATYQMNSIEANEKAIQSLNQLQQEQQESIANRELLLTASVANSSSDKDTAVDRRSISKAFMGELEQYKKLVMEVAQQEAQLGQAFSAYKKNDISSLIAEVEGLGNAGKDTSQDIASIRSQMLDFARTLPETIQNTARFKTVLNTLENSNSTIQDLSLTWKNLGGEITNAQAEMQAPVWSRMSSLTDEQQASVRQLSEQWRQGAITQEQLNMKLRESNIGLEQFNKLTHTVSGVERFTAIAGSLGSVYMMLNSIKSLWETWSDDEATIGEKMLASLMTVSMLVPAVTGSLKGLTTALGYQSLAEANAATATGVRSVATKIQTAIQAIATTGTVADTNAEIENTAAEVAGTAAEVVDTEATVANTVAEVADTVAVVANTEAEVANAAATGAATVATKGLRAALLANPVTAAIAGLALLATILYGVAKHNEEVAKKTREANDAQIESYKTAKSEQGANDALVKSYNESLAAYKENAENKDSLVSATEAVCDAYDLEGESLAQLTGDYDLLTESIKKSQKAKLEAALKDAQQAKESAGKNLQTSLDSSGSFGSQVVLNSDVKDAIEAIGNENLYVYDRVSNYSGSQSIKYDAVETPEEAYQMYEDILQLQEDIADVEGIDTIQTNISEWLANNEEDYLKYKDILEDIQELEIQLTEFAPSLPDINQVTDVASYEAYKDAFIAAATEGAPEEDIERITTAAETYVSSLSQLKKYAVDSAGLDELQGKYSLNDSPKTYYDNLSDEDKTLFWQIDFDLNKNEDNWDAAIDYLKAKAEGEEIDVAIKTIGEAKETLSDGKGLSQDSYENLRDESNISWGENGIIEFSDFLAKTYIEQSRYLEELETEYTNKSLTNLEERKTYLEDYQKYLAEQELQNAEDQLNSYKTTLKAVEEAGGSLPGVLSADELNKLIDESAELVIKAEADLDNIQDDIDNLDLDIEIEAKLNRDKEFNDLLDDLSDMKDINDDLAKNAKTVGDHYEITASQARDWVNVYPELLDQATVTDEGIVQLDKNVLDNFILSKEAELKANGEADIAQLEMEKSVLEGKKASAQAEVDLAIAAATAESENARKIAEFKLELGNSVTKGLIENGIDEATANKLAAAAMAGNQEEYAKVAMQVATDTSGNFDQAAYDSAMAIYGSMQASSANVNEFAARAAEAAKQVAAIGEGKVVTTGGDAFDGVVFTDDYTGDYTAGSGTFSGTDFNYEGKTLSLDEFIADKTLDLSGYDADIAEIDTKIAEIRASMAGGLESYTPGTVRTKDPDDKDDKDGSDDKKNIEELEEVLERYHEITEEIEYQDDLLSKISKATERAYGTDKIKLLEEESGILEKQLDNYEQLALLQAGFLVADQSAVQEILPEAEFDADSQNITNYSALVQSAIDELDTATTTYNNSAQEDVDKEAYETAQKKYKEIMEVLEQYEETLDGVRDSQQKVIDTTNELADNKLEQITVKVEIDIDVNDDELELLSYFMDKIKDNSFALGDTLSQLEIQAGLYTNQAQIYTDGIKELMDLSNSGEELTQAQVDTLREYKSGLLETNEALLEINKTMKESFLKALEECTSDLDDSLSVFDTYNNILDHYNDILELSGVATKDFGLNLTIASAAVENSLNAIVGAKEKYDFLLTSQADAERGLSDAIARGDQESIEHWTKTLDDVKGQVLEAFDEMNAAWVEALQAASDQFELAVEQTIKTLEDALSPLLTLDEFQDAFDKAETIKDQYLTANEQAYELSKLSRDIQGSLDKSNNLSGAQELKTLLEEINDIQAEGKELSEYDLKYLQAKYDLKLAEIALEEAQNNKSTMRLTRNSSGNYDYVYTADQGNINDATQNYEDKLRELESLSEDYITDLSDQIIQNEQDMAAALAEIDKNNYDNTADYYQALKDTAQYYYDRDAYLRDEMSNAVENLGITYEDTTLGQIENLGSLEDAHTNLVENTDGAIGTMTEAWGVWYETVSQAAENAGVDFDNLSETVDGNVGDMIEDSNELADSFKDDTDDMEDYMDSVTDGVIDWQKQWSDSIGQMIRDNEALIASINAVIAAQSGSAHASSNNYDAGTDYSALMASHINNGGEVGDAVWVQLLAQRDAKIEGEGLSKDYYGTQGKDTADFFDDNSNQDWFDEAEKIYGDDWKEKLKELGIVGFSSGGYTGDWGMGGKLGVLHEKEIVLNETDTSNILASVNAIRALSGDIGSIINANSFNVASLLASIFKLKGAEGAAAAVQQVVSIDASFPGVQSAIEIEQALNNIVNDAAQYASVKNIE